MAFLWSLWSFNLNRWLFQRKLLHMIHISWKNYEILKFWVLDFGFGLQNFFWPLKVFLRSLVSNKSSGMQKLYFWAIFHAKQFLLLIFHSGSLCFSILIFCPDLKQMKSDSQGNKGKRENKHGRQSPFQSHAGSLIIYTNSLVDATFGPGKKLC